MLCVYSNLIAYYFNFLLSLLLYNLQAEIKTYLIVNRNGRPDLLTGKLLNEKLISSKKFTEYKTIFPDLKMLLKDTHSETYPQIKLKQLQKL